MLYLFWVCETKTGVVRFFDYFSRWAYVQPYHSECPCETCQFIDAAEHRENIVEKLPKYTLPPLKFYLQNRYSIPQNEGLFLLCGIKYFKNRFRF